jgi:hypothetical protein
LASQHEIEQWLQEGIIAAKAGRYDQARFRLLDVVQENQTNETAWYWLYHLFNNYEDRRVCLENLITINPHNDWAHRELLKYLGQSASIPANHATHRPTAVEASPSSRRKRKGQAISGPRPLVLKLMIAFWVGISTTFLGGGIIAMGEWFITSMRSRSFPNYVTVFEALQFLTAIGFVVVGVTSLIVAVLLFYRSMAGFYGSILLGLGLLLMGPTVSLIVTPANYLTLVCTGGISGMIVLLTLASQPAFERK